MMTTMMMMMMMMIIIIIINKWGKPYTRLQSQGQGHVIIKWPTVVASLILIAGLVAESMQR